jgi:hypothetical protein
VNIKKIARGGVNTGFSPEKNRLCPFPSNTRTAFKMTFAPSHSYFFKNPRFSLSKKRGFFFFFNLNPEAET